MRNFLSCFLIVLLSFGLIVNEASAKRFGGGRSFGVQRSKSSLFSSPHIQNTKPMGQKGTSSKKWGGVLGGLLVGGLLASLFMGHGLTSGLLSWLLVGAAIFFLINFFKRRMQPGYQSSQANAYQQSSWNKNSNQFYTNNNGNSSHSNNYPTGFIAEEFLRDAKIKFIRLQAAYDQKNLQDLNDFTAPEVFAEIKMQLDERGDAPNKTEVLNLDAELLNVSKQVDSFIASVRFTGSVKENNEPLSELDEIWHFRQFPNSNVWVVGGIQQDVYEAP